MLTMDKGPAGGPAVTHTTIASKLGELTVVAHGDRVVGLYFPGHWHRPDPVSFGAGRDLGFDAVRDQISQYLAGERQEFTLAVATSGERVSGARLGTGPPDPVRRDHHLR